MGRPPDPRSVQFRGFVREFMLTKRAQQRVRKAILEDSRVLTKAMDIAAGRMDEEPGAGATSPIFVMLAERLAVLPPEALETFAATGELDPAAYLPDVRALALAVPRGTTGTALGPQTPPGAEMTPAPTPGPSAPQNAPENEKPEKPHRERVIDAVRRYVERTSGLAPAEGEVAGGQLRPLNSEAAA